MNAWLAVHHTTDCWFAYSVIAGVPDYDKVPCKPLPTGLAVIAGQPEPIVPPHIKGTVLVSAEDASGALWGPGKLNPYRQFQDGQPADMIGNSILVYNGDFDIPLAAAETHASQVPLLLRMHQVDAALHEARTAVTLDPQSPAIEASLGGTLLQIQKADEARQAFAIARSEARAQSVEEAAAIDAEIAAMQHPQP